MKAAGRNRDAFKMPSRCLHDAFVALKAKAAGRQRKGIAMPSGCFHEAFTCLGLQLATKAS